MIDFIQNWFSMVTTLWKYIFFIISDIPDILRLMVHFITEIPKCIAFLPPFWLSIIGMVLVFTVVIKVLGMEV